MKRKQQVGPYPPHRVRWTDVGDESDGHEFWPDGDERDADVVPVDEYIRGARSRDDMESDDAWQ